MFVSVLVVGGGSIGERHLRCFQQVGADVALCENHDARREELAARYGLRHALASLEEACSRDWDIAVISTPAHLHVQHSVQLAQHASALLIEKPLATRVEDVAQLRLATEGKVMGVAYVLRGHPAVEAVREVVASGAIGRLLQVNVVGGQHFPTFRPAYRTIYYRDRTTGGGAIQDAVTHMVDLVQCLAGRFDWVFCDYAHQALEGVDVEDTVHLVGRTSGERVMVSISVNQFMAPNESHLQLNGSEGSALIRIHEQRYGILLHGQTAWEWHDTLVPERDDLFRLQAQRFLNAAAGREPALCSLDEAEHDLRVCLAALESNGERRVAIAESRKHERAKTRN